MRIVRSLWRGALIIGVLFATLALPASADRMTSTSYILNGNADSSFGGQSGSTNYGAFTTGGEAAVGGGASGSYITSQGTTAQFQKSIQVTAQPGGLLGYWNFDEATGTQFTDSSATLAHGNLTGTLGNFSSVTGKLGNALSSTAANSDSSVIIPGGSIQPTSVTMSVWFKPTTLPSEWNSLCSYYAKAGEDWGAFEMYTDGDHNGTSFSWNIHHLSGNQDVSTYPSGVYSPGSWYHVVGTYNAATGIMKIYVNGVEAATKSVGAEAIDYNSSNTSNQISCFNNPRFPNEGVNGALDHLKIFSRALTAAEVKAEYDAQNGGTPSGLSLGTITPGTSNTALVDVIVRTDSGEYGVAVSQDHDLQKGGDTIPAVSASIASPAAWNEGTTTGLGFTLLTAPNLDGKWGAGANYAAFPGSPTTFYTRSGHTSSDTIDTLFGRLRLDVSALQTDGAYSNTVTYTGTTIP